MSNISAVWVFIGFIAGLLAGLIVAIGLMWPDSNQPGRADRAIKGTIPAPAILPALPPSPPPTIGESMDECALRNKEIAEAFLEVERHLQRPPEYKIHRGKWWLIYERELYRPLTIDEVIWHLRHDELLAHRVYVMAGTYGEWMHNVGKMGLDPTKTLYLSRASQLRGLKGMTVIWCKTHVINRESHRISDLIKITESAIYYWQDQE